MMSKLKMPCNVIVCSIIGLSILLFGRSYSYATSETEQTGDTDAVVSNSETDAEQSFDPAITASETPFTFEYSENGGAVIVSHFMYYNFPVGTPYKVHGELYEMIQDDTGNLIPTKTEIISETEFITSTIINTVSMPDGSAVTSGEVSVYYDLSSLADLHDRVFFTVEKLDSDGMFNLSSENFNNSDRYIKVPSLISETHDSKTGGNTIACAEKTSIITKATYSNLQPGKEYIIKGKLQTSIPNAPSDLLHTISESDYEFTPESPDGSVDIVNEANTSNIMGSQIYTKLELFEKEQNNPMLTVDSVQRDESAIVVPYASVSIKDSSTNNQTVSYSESSVLTVDLAYKHLVPSQKYTVETLLVDTKNNKTVMSSKSEFTPFNPDGTEYINLKFNAKKNSGKTLTCKVKIWAGKDLILESAIQNNQNNTLYLPTIKKAYVEKMPSNNALIAGERISFYDKVTFDNLETGRVYTIRFVVIDAKTGKTLKDEDGDAFVLEKSFIHNNPSTEYFFDVSFYNSDKLGGKTIAVTESLYSNVLIFERNKLPSGYRGLTISKPSPTPKPTATPKPTPTPKPDDDYETDSYTEYVYVTRTGNKYHTESCRFAHYSGVQEMTEKEARERGYAPCKICH